jgi:hypothetical protein
MAACDRLSLDGGRGAGCAWPAIPPRALVSAKCGCRFCWGVYSRYSRTARRWNVEGTPASTTSMSARSLCRGRRGAVARAPCTSVSTRPPCAICRTAPSAPGRKTSNLPPGRRARASQRRARRVPTCRGGQIFLPRDTVPPTVDRGQSPRERRWSVHVPPTSTWYLRSSRRRSLGRRAATCGSAPAGAAERGARPSELVELRGKLTAP